MILMILTIYLLLNCAIPCFYASVSTLGHPRFFNQLSTGLDIVSMAGEWLTATANTNMFTYEIAPVFILMEHAVLKKMRDIIGFTNGDSILAPGGSISNMYALMIARHKMFPQHKSHGMRAIKGQLIMYTSKHPSKHAPEAKIHKHSSKSAPEAQIS